MWGGWWISTPPPILRRQLGVPQSSPVHELSPGGGIGSCRLRARSHETRRSPLQTPSQVQVVPCASERLAMNQRLHDPSSGLIRVRKQLGELRKTACWLDRPFITKNFQGDESTAKGRDTWDKVPDKEASGLVQSGPAGGAAHGSVPAPQQEDFRTPSVGVL